MLKSILSQLSIRPHRMRSVYSSLQKSVRSRGYIPPQGGPACTTRAFYRQAGFTPQGGFTLIELLIVFTLIVTISSVGFVGVRDYAVRQSVTDTRLDIESQLKLARSRAQTQVKPAVCTSSQALNGYRVRFVCTTATCTRMELIAVCGGADAETVSTTTFPSEVTVTVSSPTPSFQFHTISGIVSGNATITVRNDTNTPQIIRVYDDGRIQSEVQ